MSLVVPVSATRQVNMEQFFKVTDSPTLRFPLMVYGDGVYYVAAISQLVVQPKLTLINQISSFVEWRLTVAL